MQMKNGRPCAFFQINPNPPGVPTDLVDVFARAYQHALQREWRAIPVTIQPADIHAHVQVRAIDFLF